MSETTEEKAVDDEHEFVLATVNDDGSLNEHVLDADGQKVTNDMIDAYGLRDGLGDRALILPTPDERAPASPFGSMEPVVDPGWARNDVIAKVLDRAKKRDGIFMRGAEPPQLGIRHDRNRNVAVGYPDENDPLVVIQQKRKLYYLITGGAHPAGAREQISKFDTYSEALEAAWIEARRFPPACLIGGQMNVTLLPEGNDGKVDWSQFMGQDDSWRDIPEI